MVLLGHVVLHLMPAGKTYQTSSHFLEVVCEFQAGD